MSQVFRWCRAALVALCIMLPPMLVQASPEIMPVDQLKPGMQGVAKTVVTGTKIEEFNVEVLGVMKDKGPSGDLILVRTSGDLIDHTGGIVQGMSGSPVYINGKLVGAIAYGWPLADHKVGMVTPIADMLKMLDMPKAGQRPFLAVPSQLEPAVTPLMVSGFSDQALNMLKDKLQPFNLVPYAVGTAPDTLMPTTALQPGSAAAIELVRGDMSIGAIGTVTYVDGDKVLAFGHPFLKKGQVDYFLSNAYIYTTVSALDNGFKVGTAGPLLGHITQDRGAGVAGETDKYPSIIPLRITVTDNSLGVTKEADVQIVQDEQLAPVLAATTIFNVIEKTLDRVGPGTAKVDFEIIAKDMPGDSLKRQNMFYSAGSIGESAVSEIQEALAMLMGNQFNPVDIMDVKVNIAVDSDRLTASILDAKANKMTVKPGENVNITVRLKPYRGEPFTRTITYTVPKDQAPGPLALEVRGGGSVPLTRLILKQQGLDESTLMLGSAKPQTFADVIKEFSSRDRNNDLVVEVMDTNLEALTKQEEAGTQQPTKAVPDTSKLDKGKKALKPGVLVPEMQKTDDGRNKAVAATDVIIDGDTQLMLNVVK